MIWINYGSCIIFQRWPIVIYDDDVPTDKIKNVSLENFILRLNFGVKSTSSFNEMICRVINLDTYLKGQGHIVTKICVCYRVVSGLDVLPMGILVVKCL